MANRFNRERAHSLTVSSARFAAARHSFSSRGRARMLKFTEREEATRDLYGAVKQLSIHRPPW